MKCKKITAVFLALLFLLAGCAGGKKLTGRIARIYGGMLLLAGDDGTLYYAAIGDADTGGEKLGAGQRAVIEYRGGVRETAPAELEKVTSISLTGEQSNLIDLYVAVTREVIGTEQYSAAAYDFSGTTQLSAAEQRAVGYICWTEMDLEPYYGTEEELLEQEILLKKDKVAYLRSGCILHYFWDEQDPTRLTVVLRRGARAEETYVYTLAQDGEIYTQQLIEKPAEE